jgi:hypothetical protein
MTKNQTNIHQDRKSNTTALSTVKEILIYVQERELKEREFP